MKRHAPQAESTARQRRPAASVNGRAEPIARRTAAHGLAQSPRVQRLAQDKPLIANSPYVAAQRQRLNHMFGPGLVQRYSLINPIDYTLGVGSKFSKQDAVVAGGSAGFTRTTRERTGAGVVSSQEQGIGAGAWSPPTVPVASARPTIKYGTDGTDAIALESTTAEPKVFYATPGVLVASNAKLESVQAEARLVNAGGSLLAPQDPANLAGPTLNLHMVKPGKTPTGQAPQVLEKFGQISECNAFIKYVVGELTERVAVFGGGAGHEALAEEEKEPTQDIATFASANANPQALAAHLTTSNITSGRHDAPLPAPYTGMVNKPARDQALGINAGARAGVGEGYVITQNSPMPGDVTLRAWLDALDHKLALAAMTAAELDMFKHKWGYHYAGVVAAVGGDAITLENYNRGTQKHWALDDLYNQRIGATAALRRHLEVLAGQGKNIPSVPMLRNQWFTTLKNDLTALGTAASADQAASRDALIAVADAVRGLDVGAPDLWHFKMYGDQAGQSFHEQWEGSLDNPMTLRIRQSQDLSRTRYLAQLDAASTQLHSEHVGAAAALVLGRINAFHVPGLRDAVTTKAINDAFANGRKDLLKACGLAMHGWAVDAARLVDKKDTTVPDAPSDTSTLRTYATRLDTLIQPWETKGWAVRQASKLALAARQARLADLRRKIGVARALT